MKGITSLLKSRKTILAIAAVVVAIAGRYGLDLDPVTVAVSIAGIVTNILGIAIEDAAEKSRPAVDLIDR